MTVVAAFSIDTCPVLVGDLLISSHESLRHTLNIPTIGDITQIFPKGSGFVPTGLRQKVSIMNENLAVAWSGSGFSSQIILSHLLRECKKRNYWTLSDLASFFSSFDKDHGTEVGIVGYSNDGKGVFSFSYGAVEIKYQSDKYGLVRLSGSGASDLKNSLENFSIPPASRTTNPLEKAVGNTLAITTYMTGVERVTSINLLEYYGGGFEIVSFVRKRFTKIDDITYLIWAGHQIGDSSWTLSPPERCIKYYYHKDALLIRKVAFEPQSVGVLKPAGESIYSVSPIYKDIDEAQLRKIKLSSFNSRFLCSFVILYSMDGSINVLNRVNYSSQKGGPIRFAEDGKHLLGMDIHSDFVKTIFEGITRPSDTTSREKK